MIEEIIKFNKEFVTQKKYEEFISGKFPDKKIAILSCMDTRLTELLPAALGFKNGDVKVIKNAGAIISSPFGSAMRSLIVAIYDLNVTEILIIGHHDCGMQSLDYEKIIEKMRSRGISSEKIDLVKYCGIDFKEWLHGFESVVESVEATVELVKNHPLIPVDVNIHGLIIDPVTGELDSI
ncbi:MAG: carbonic anhydrase [Bacillota bacterium]